MLTPRTLVAAFVALTALFVAGCSNDDLPSKSEFIDEVKSQAGAEFSQAAEEVGLDESTANQILDNFLGCVYDAISDNEDELRAVLDNEGDTAFDQVLEEKAGDCLATYQEELQDAVLGG